MLELLDLLQQRRMTDLTRAVIEVLIKPRFAESERLELMARQYFPRYDRRQITATDREEIAEQLRAMSRSLKSYFCYVLADFALTDPDLDDLVLLEAIGLADHWEMTDVFDEIAGRDLAIDAVHLARLRSRVSQGLPQEALTDGGKAVE
ncbi:hypothetical protein [uncultured Roseibium sp.]|uniref:hypothetical protein n=1 Tax=uncultured Roseibium sp. TaxID=1936171 RepID=UPI0026348D14|nr:hypothetical protein [uncultured Roseibium sp.]